MNTTKTIKLAKQLIEIPSMTGQNDNSLKALKLIKQKLETSSIKTKLLFNNSFPTLWASNKSFENSDILLLCHIDVVKAESQDFIPSISQDKLTGRGAFDMKGPLAAMVEVIRTIKSDKNIHLVITSDEEIGGHNGAKWFFESTKLKPKIAIVPDSTNHQHLITKQKGPMHLLIEVDGKSCHASQPWLGKNPINALQMIQKEIKEVSNQANNEKDWLPTFTVTNIKAECSINQIPDKATMTIDIRSTNEEQINKIKQIIKKHDGIINKTFGDGKILNQNNSDTIKFWKKIAEETHGQSIELRASCGATDARHLPSNTNVIITQAEGGNAHGNNEWIDTKSLEQLVEITKKFIKTI